MNNRSIEKEVTELSEKLEKKMAELSREGIERDSRELSNGEADNEIFQLNRQRELSENLNEIMESLMNTFSRSSESSVRGIRQNDGRGTLSDEDEIVMTDEKDLAGTGRETIPEDDRAEQSAPEASEELTPGNPSISPGQSENSDSPDSDTGSGDKEGDRTGGTEPAPSRVSPPVEEGDLNSENIVEKEDFEQLLSVEEKRESGEFNEENIRGELHDGEQMKSFIRALPRMAEPTLEEMEILTFYNNQLETVIDREILPEGYESLIRDYFLGIGVLNE